MLKRFTTHSLMALAEASLIALLVVGLIAGTAFAGKGGKEAEADRWRIPERSGSRRSSSTTTATCRTAATS